MKKIYIIVLVAFGIISCSDWLDVQPKTAIPGDKLFESEAGFKDVLTGFYLKMESENLYAKELTYGYLELLSGNYDNYPGFKSLDKTQMYEYDGLYLDLKNRIYLEMYNIIANINNFLKYLEKNRSVVKTKHYYEMMKGEALGLRAFLHFDLLRLFGPVYSANSSEKTIPYRNTFDDVATSRLTADQVITSVLADLEEAYTLLEQHDPRNFGYPDLLNSNYNAFENQRQLRMNVYAVKALMARVYCYRGDEASREKAVQCAQEVIAAPHFKLCTSNTTLVLYEEHIFGLNVYELNKLIDTYFSDNELSGFVWDHTFILEENFNSLYDFLAGGATDFRAQSKAFKSVMMNGKVYKYCRKYNQSGYADEYSGKNIVPLIRLSEMYYIIAECESDKAKSAEALNNVRWKRGISYTDEILPDDSYDLPDTRSGYDPTQTVRINEIMKEYRKDFYAEGQLFYFYKHRDYKTFAGCPISDVRGKYQWTVPDNEIIFGNNK
ncbi:RagB/SusD family nutrient uptake outer membrane protein [Gabonibacter chumensis]|uniref:RagB/SusD family nutrient uptake outer membrane protein n=1 Tax=Gabonibacter chumensis TaxID=2972474 RepID=UPI0025730658|nr:RagB/SusD family nutrient uptake outer membrane protein [Gabonibacter chumensis]MCR9011928.1 RagB/SusD family nutrient uptake outer membrane protein [Gabonibacter chumensis]